MYDSNGNMKAPQNCYNVGSIEGDIVAPIYCGMPKGMTGEEINSYCIDECKPVINNGGYYDNDTAIYLTSEEMKGAASLLGDAFCTDEEGINKGYPILKWQLNN